MEQPNLDYFEKLSNNNSNFKQKLIDVVKYEFPIELSNYYVSVQQNNLIEVSESVHKLKNKISSEGVLQVTASESRTQLQNKKIAIERIQELVDKALIVPKKRIATKPSRAQKEKRLENKKKISEKKENRKFRF